MERSESHTFTAKPSSHNGKIYLYYVYEGDNFIARVERMKVSTLVAQDMHVGKLRELTTFIESLSKNFSL